MPWSKRRRVMIDRIMRCQMMRMDGPSWVGVSQSAKEFCTSLIRMDPDDRPTADKALQLPWIQQKGYPKTSVRVSQDEQSQLRASFRRNAWGVLASKLTESEIGTLREALEENDVDGEGLIRLDEFRRILTERRWLSLDDVSSLFDNDQLDSTQSIEYIDLIVEVLTGRGRNTMDDLAKALDDADVDGTRKVRKDELRIVLERHVSAETQAEFWRDVERGDDDATVNNDVISTVQVLEFVGREVARHQRDSIRSEEGGGDDEADSDDGLVDEMDVVIPGGRVLNGAREAKYVYDTEHKSMRKV